jgi:hypothetical protein
VRHVCLPKVAGSSPSGGSESTFRSDLLLTAKGSSTRAPIVVCCPLCYPGLKHTLLSAPKSRAEGLGRRYTNPHIYFIYLFIYFYYFFLNTFIAHYPRVSSKRFTFTLTLLAAMLPG